MGDVGVGAGQGRPEAPACAAPRCHWQPTRRAMDGARVVEGEELGSNAGRVQSTDRVGASEREWGDGHRFTRPPVLRRGGARRRRTLERAVIDVRFALARETTVEGSCLALVCDSKYSYWRVLDASDPSSRRCARERPLRRGSTARRRAGVGDAHARDGVSRESATSLISFDAVVRWVKVELEGERRYRRVPRMLLEEETPPLRLRDVSPASSECERELVPDRNGVYTPVNARRRATM